MTGVRHGNMILHISPSMNILAKFADLDRRNDPCRSEVQSIIRSVINQFHRRMRSYSADSETGLETRGVLSKTCDDANPPKVSPWGQFSW